MNYKCLIIIIFINKITKYLSIYKLNCVSAIEVTIMKSGELNIFSDQFSSSPIELIVNNKSYENITTKISSSRPINSIVMGWHSSLNNCSNMFTGLNYISKVDFTNFTNKITDMSYIFYNCSS